MRIQKPDKKAEEHFWYGRSYLHLIQKTFLRYWTIKFKELYLKKRINIWNIIMSLHLCYRNSPLLLANNINNRCNPRASKFLLSNSKILWRMSNKQDLHHRLKRRISAQLRAGVIIKLRPNRITFNLLIILQHSKSKIELILKTIKPMNNNKQHRWLYSPRNNIKILSTYNNSMTSKLIKWK